MTTKPARSRRSADEVLPPWLRRLIIVVFSVAVLAPVAYIVVMSLTPNGLIGSSSILPTRWVISNYGAIWSAVPLFRGFINSLFIGGVASAIAVTVGLGAGYVLARFVFVGRRPFLLCLVGLQTVPGVMILLPLYVVFAYVQTRLGLPLIGTYPAVMLTYLTFSIPFATWLEYSYIAGIPADIEEAALVDGTTRVGALVRVVLPLALPGVVVAFTFSFLAVWNDVLFASVLTRGPTQTLAVMLQAFSSSQAGLSLPLYGDLMAAAVLSAVPVVVVYMLVQRYLVSGALLGGIKA